MELGFYTRIAIAWLFGAVVGVFIWALLSWMREKGMLNKLTSNLKRLWHVQPRRMSPITATGVFAEKGEEIYRRKYLPTLNVLDYGRFVAIDVETEDAYFGDTSEEALTRARERRPDAWFHLIRIGHKTAFKS